MQIEEFSQCKLNMEVALRTKISEVIEDFKSETGYSPSSISVDFINVSTVGSERDEYQVSNVTTEVEL